MLTEMQVLESDKVRQDLLTERMLSYEKPIFSGQFVDMMISKVHERLVQRLRKRNDTISENLLDDLCMLFIHQVHVAEDDGMILGIGNNEMLEIVGKLSHSLEWNVEWSG
jgi:hypothetical protein